MYANTINMLRTEWNRAFHSSKRSLKARVKYRTRWSCKREHQGWVVVWQRTFSPLAYKKSNECEQTKVISFKNSVTVHFTITIRLISYSR